MKKVNIWQTNVKNSITYIDNIEDVINYFKNNKKTNFSVIDKNGLEDGKILTTFIDIISEKGKKADMEINYVDDEHPVFFDNFDDVCLSKDFYEKNKDIITSTIEDNLFESKYVHISKYMYSDSLVKNLCLTANSISFDEGIELPDDVIKILKHNRINSYVYKDGERIEISTNQILGQNYKNVISDSEDVYIKSNITDLENLKYIPSNKIIHINQENEFKRNAILEEDYDGIYNIVSKLRENNQTNKVIIEIKNRNEFSKSKLYNSNFDLTIEGIDIEPYKIEDLKEENKLLDLMVKDIKDSNLSPFEKYIAAYNIVKKFKKYLENVNDKSQSRYLRKFLNNDYMVCVGYATLLQELLNRIGINSYDYAVSTDISYDDGFTSEEKTVELAGHARIILKLEDPKYNINGFYVADPTWDNDLENDYYNHALMSFDKTCQERRMFRLSHEDLFMNVKSMEEFNQKVNFFLDHEKKSLFYANYDEKGKEKNAINALVDNIKNVLISLAPEQYIILKNKYLNNYDENADINLLTDFITDAGKIFIDNLGKDVPIETIIDAAGVVNKYVFGFTYEEFERYKEELLRTNIENDEIKFPYYYENAKTK